MTSSKLQSDFDSSMSEFRQETSIQIIGGEVQEDDEVLKILLHRKGYVSYTSFPTTHITDIENTKHENFFRFLQNDKPQKDMSKQ